MVDNERRRRRRRGIRLAVAGVALLCLAAFAGPPLLYRTGMYPGTLESVQTGEFCQALSVQTAHSIDPYISAEVGGYNGEYGECEWSRRGDFNDVPMYLKWFVDRPGLLPFQTPQAEAHRTFVNLERSLPAPGLFPPWTPITGLGDEAAQVAAVSPAQEFSYILARTGNVAWYVSYLGPHPPPGRLLTFARAIATNFDSRRL